MPDASRGVVAGHARDRRRSGRADPAPNDNGAGITTLQKCNVRRHRYGGSIDQRSVRSGVPHGGDIHEIGGKNMCFFQAQGLGVQFGQIGKIRVAPAAASPRHAPIAIVSGEVCREGIHTGNDLIKMGQAKMFSERLRRISVGDRASVGTVRRTGRRPEVLGILEHLRLQTGNRRTRRQTQGIPRPQKTLASEGARHDRGARTR